MQCSKSDAAIQFLTLHASGTISGLGSIPDYIGDVKSPFSSSDVSGADEDWRQWFSLPFLGERTHGVRWGGLGVEV